MSTFINEDSVRCLQCDGCGRQTIDSLPERSEWFDDESGLLLCPKCSLREELEKTQPWVLEAGT